MAKRKHCKTCNCFIGKRHTCKHCKTKKLEKYMRLVGRIRGWGNGGYWECSDKTNCTKNTNYA